MAEPSLWAAYLQMTTPGDRGEIKRNEWIFLPPLPPELAPEGSRTTPSFTFFTRSQEKLTHRTVWQYKTGWSLARMSTLIEALESQGWTASPLVTCAVAPWEMAEILKDQKTPYRLLTRFRRVVAVTHRYTI